MFEFNSSETKHGEVYSPNYPHVYPNKIDCRYEFYGLANERVLLQIDDFQLEPPNGGTHSLSETGSGSSSDSESLHEYFLRAQMPTRRVSSATTSPLKVF